MPDMNQIEIPQSFMALFVTAGRFKPSTSLEVVIGRYELCEDMFEDERTGFAFEPHLKKILVLGVCGIVVRGRRGG